MRIFLLVILANLAIGCGGEVEASASDDEAGSTPTTCDPNNGPQHIGEVADYVFAIQTAGSSTYAVATASGNPANLGIAGNLGTLYRINGVNSSTALTDNLVDYLDIASAGGSIGFFHASIAASGALVDTSFETIDAAGNISAVQPPGATPSYGTLTSDGASFEWTQFSGPESAAHEEVGKLGSGDPFTLVGSNVLFPSDIVSDGAHVYGLFVSNGSGYVIGSIALDTLVTTVLDPNPGSEQQMVGVDDQNVYYVASADSNATQGTLWSVSKFGNGPAVAIASLPASSRVVVRNGNAYWIETQTTGSSSIMSVPLTLVPQGDAQVPLQAPSELAGSAVQINALGFDACGLVYAWPDTATSSSIMRLALP